MTKKTFTKETLRRMGRTVFQVSLSYIVTNIPFIDFNAPEDVLRSAFIGLLVSALSAGIAAVMNLEEVTESEVE